MVKKKFRFMKEHQALEKDDICWGDGNRLVFSDGGTLCNRILQSSSDKADDWYRRLHGKLKPSKLFDLDLTPPFFAALTTTTTTTTTSTSTHTRSDQTSKISEPQVEPCSVTSYLFPFVEVLTDAIPPGSRQNSPLSLAINCCPSCIVWSSVYAVRSTISDGTEIITYEPIYQKDANSKNDVFVRHYRPIATRIQPLTEEAKQNIIRCPKATVLNYFTPGLRLNACSGLHVACVNWKCGEWGKHWHFRPFQVKRVASQVAGEHTCNRVVRSEHHNLAFCPCLKLSDDNDNDNDNGSPVTMSNDTNRNDIQ